MTGDEFENALAKLASDALKSGMTAVQAIDIIKNYAEKWELLEVIVETLDEDVPNQ